MIKNIIGFLIPKIQKTLNLTKKKREKKVDNFKNGIDKKEKNQKNQNILK